MSYVYHENMNGRVIRSYREGFSIAACNLDDFTDWKIETIHAEILGGKISFYAYCKSMETNPLVPYMEIKITPDGMANNYRLMPKRSQNS